MKVIRFGIIGCGMMGREFASAAARWCHLTETEARPHVVAICNRTLSPNRIDWFTEHFPSITQVTDDYRELLKNSDVDAVYCAVPHHLHQQLYCAAIEAGTHLLGEKPFGIDLAANEAIIDCMAEHPGPLVRCSSQFLFFPGVQRMLQMVVEGALGRIIDVDSGFLHSSDLDPLKPINWKRMSEYNGEYGVLGDLGAHLAYLPARFGWNVENVRALCSNIVPQRPDGHGSPTPCDTWDNATLLSEVSDPVTGERFPWTFRAARIMPGERNTWYLSIHGTKRCARFSLKNPALLELLEYNGGEQRWEQINMGFETSYPTITGGIFQFGAPDAFMQMMAAYIYELVHGAPLNAAAACPTPEEMHCAHVVFSAALQSHRDQQVVSLESRGGPSAP